MILINLDFLCYDMNVNVPVYNLRIQEREDTESGFKGTSCRGEKDAERN